MKYRQWKKNYKKRYGVNPPLELDKRKQRRLLKKRFRKIEKTDFGEIVLRAAEAVKSEIAYFMRAIGRACDSVGTACRNAADNIKQIEIEGNVIGWNIRENGMGYAVYETNSRTEIEKEIAHTYSRNAAEKIKKILKAEYEGYMRRLQERTFKEYKGGMM